MRIPTIKQYKEAIPNLKRRQLEALQALYECPNASATVEMLAKRLYPSKQRRHFPTTGLIGRTAKHIADFLGIVPKDIEIFSEIISPPYRLNESWRMHKNLQMALEELDLVSKR
jgi:hypothetical protein